MDYKYTRDWRGIQAKWVEDFLILYFRYNPIQDTIEIFFNNERDCILWKLKYGT